MNAGRGGVVNVVWRLAELLRDRLNHEVVVISDHGNDLDRLVDMGVTHELVPFRGQFKTLWASRQRLRRIYQDFQPDIVHSHSRWPSMVSIAAGRRPDVSTLHMSTLTGHGSRWDIGWLRRQLSGWGSTVTTLDQTARQMLISELGLAPDRIAVVPNGIDHRRFHPLDAEARQAVRRELGLGPADRVAVFVGALIDRKRPDWCIDAVAQARQSGNADARLVLMGHGDMSDTLRSRLQADGLKDVVLMPGHVDPLPWYQAADVMLLPSTTEGFPLVCVEAMLCGLPLIRTRSGGCDEQIEEGKTGHIVEVDDHQGFIDRTVSLLGDAELSDSFGRSSQQRALDHFTEGRYLELLMEIYGRYSSAEVDQAVLEEGAA
ncbi:MAG: glycosyltransferase family 4 protein [Planctomycetota bacterium]